MLFRAGELTRAVLNAMREHDRPVALVEIVTAIIKAKGLSPELPDGPVLQGARHARLPAAPREDRQDWRAKGRPLARDVAISTPLIRS